MVVRLRLGRFRVVSTGRQCMRFGTEIERLVSGGGVASLKVERKLDDDLAR